MFAKIFSAVSIALLALPVVLALPQGSSTSQCNVEGANECCESYQTAEQAVTDATTLKYLEALAIPIEDLTTGVGLSCSPITG